MAFPEKSGGFSDDNPIFGDLSEGYKIIDKFYKLLS